MKTVTILAVSLMAAWSSLAEQTTLEELSSHLFTNGPIVWQASTNNLPKSFWIYRRALPHVFPAAVISNAIALSALQGKGIPKPSTNNFYIAEDKGPNYPGPIANIFSIEPGDAHISYSVPNYGGRSGNNFPVDETIIARAWKYASQLALDTAKLVQKGVYTQTCDDEQNGKVTNYVCGRGIFLSRQLDGVTFFSLDKKGEGAEGFSIEFGGRGQIRCFSLRWSNVERYKSQQTASPQEIIQCIRAHKTIVLPNGDDSYFAKLKSLATAKKIIITKITPYYGDSVFGETPTNDAPCQFATPVAELNAVADFGNSNATVQMISPITSSAINRLLEK